jgi:hypothetical protein
LPARSPLKSQALALCLQGIPVPQIAAQLHIAIPTIYRWRHFDKSSKPNITVNINQPTISSLNDSSATNQTQGKSAVAPASPRQLAAQQLEASLPDAVAVWRAALTGGKVDSNARAAAEKILKKFGLLTEDGAAHESIYEGMSDSALSKRLSDLLSAPRYCDNVTGNAQAPSAIAPALPTEPTIAQATISQSPANLNCIESNGSILDGVAQTKDDNTLNKLQLKILKEEESLVGTDTTLGINPTTLATVEDNNK